MLGREEIAAKEMGGLVAVSQGIAEEPKLIVLRYSGGGAAPPSAWSARGSPSTPAASRSSRRPAMQEMKMDMSGGAAVLEAFAAIAELGLRART